MRLSPKLVLILSIIAGALAFQMSFQVLKNSSKGPVPVVTVLRDLSVGDILENSDLKLLPAPKGTDPSVCFKTVDKVVGKTLRNALRRGQALSTFDLVSEEDNIAGLIPMGYRAATVPLSIPNDTLKSLKFGTRVDILFADTSNKSFETKTILKNALVMRADAPQNNKGMMGAGAQIPVSVTLAVKPDAAETISYASNKGKLLLSIRPTQDKNVKEEYMTLEELSGQGRKSLDLPVSYHNEIEMIKGVKKEMVKL